MGAWMLIFFSLFCLDVFLYGHLIVRFLEVLSTSTCPNAVALFYSLFNTVITFDPVGWGLPYGGYVCMSSMCVHVYLMYVYLGIFLSIDVSMYVKVYPVYAYRCVSLSIYLSIHLSIYPSIYPPMYVCMYPCTLCTIPVYSPGV